MPTRRRGASLSLTKSEVEVLTDASEGLSVQQSAARRHKGRETIKTQRSQVRAKLGARNMTQAVALAITNDLLSTRKTQDA